jgi:hypothetical protein
MRAEGGEKKQTPNAERRTANAELKSADTLGQRYGAAGNGTEHD